MATSRLWPPKVYQETRLCPPKVYQETRLRTPKVYSQTRVRPLKVYQETRLSPLKVYQETKCHISEVLLYSGLDGSIVVDSLVSIQADRHQGKLVNNIFSEALGACWVGWDVESALVNLVSHPTHDSHYTVHKD